MPRKRSTVALLEAAVSLGIVLAVGGCSGGDDEAGDDETTETTSAEAEEATVFELEEGDCLESDPGVQGEVEEVPKVPCDEPASCRTSA